jgi:hypothetical protein
MNNTNLQNQYMLMGELEDIIRNTPERALENIYSLYAEALISHITKAQYKPIIEDHISQDIISLTNENGNNLINSRVQQEYVTNLLLSGDIASFKSYTESLSKQTKFVLIDNAIEELTSVPLIKSINALPILHELKSQLSSDNLALLATYARNNGLTLFSDYLAPISQEKNRQEYIGTSSKEPINMNTSPLTDEVGSSDRVISDTPMQRARSYLQSSRDLREEAFQKLENR